jgi:Ca2+-binding EF-hand superfamily protein
MTSSIGGASTANLASLNQLLQAVGGGHQATPEGTVFKTRTQALFTALDSDGDGKVSKSELQSGFQKLSEDVKSVLLGQQDVAGVDDSNGASSSTADATVSSSGSTTEQDASSNAAAGVSELLESLMHALRDNSASALFKSIDSKGDGSLSRSEFSSGLSAVTPTDTAATSAASTGDTSSTTAGSSIADLYGQIDSNGDGSISRDEWQKMLQDLQSQDVGSLANQQGMRAQQHAVTLNNSLINLLQSIKSQAATTSATSTTA